MLYVKAKLDNWKIVISGDAYTAPELTTFHLQGIVRGASEGEPRYCTTSPIVAEEAGGNIIVTLSGSRYLLGKPESADTKTFAQMRVAYPWVQVPKARS